MLEPKIGETRPHEMNAQRILAAGFGAAFAVAGAAGYFAGDSLWVFGVNGLHNAAHLVSGAAGLLSAAYAGGRLARRFNVAMGMLYLAAAAGGFVFPSLARALANINLADNLLHLGLGALLAGVGFGWPLRAERWRMEARRPTTGR